MLRAAARSKETDRLRKARAMRVWLAVVAVAMCVGMPRAGAAEARCPWLNAATAAGLLGGEVEMRVSAPVEPAGGMKTEPGVYAMDQVRMDRYDVSCEFVRKMDGGMYTLRIAVTTMRDVAKEFAAAVAGCGGRVAIRGVGNEAYACVAAGQEEVVARVRDRVFVMTVKRGGKPGVPGELQADSRNLAEQVAGSLF